MGKYVHDCEVLEMELEVPPEDAEELLGFFDGSRQGGRVGAKAERFGRELKIESCAGRMLLTQRGSALVPDEIEVLDDREGEFLENVVLALFATYRGKLRLRIRWAGARPGSSAEEQEVEVEDGRSNWPTRVPKGPWLATAAASEASGEVRQKLEEARRHFEEYLRLKGERGHPGS
jgi:hypothetical protein